MNNTDNTKPQADNKGLNALLGYANYDTDVIIANDDFLISLNHHLKHYPLLRHDGIYTIDKGDRISDKINTTDKAIAVLVDHNLQPASLAVITPNSATYEQTEPNQPYGVLIGDVDPSTKLYAYPTLEDGLSLYIELAVKANQNIAVIAGLNKWHFQAMVKYYSHNRRLMVTTTFDNKDKFIEPLKGVNADAIITQQAPLYELSHYPYSYDEVMADAQIIDLKAVGHPKPKPISQTLPPVKRFTSDMMPATLWNYCHNAAERMSAPIEYVLIPTMVGFGTVLGTKCTIYPKKFDNWEVAANFYGAIVGKPSSKKTPSLGEGLKPLKHLVSLADEKHSKDSLEFETQKELNKHMAKAADKQLAKLASQLANQAENDDSEITQETLHAKAQELAEAKHNNELEPQMKRYVTDDGTIESVGLLQSIHKNGMLVKRDELTGWFASLDNESNQQARSFYLEGFNGLGSFQVDRIGRGAVYVETHCLSVIGGIQPDKLEYYLSKAIKGLGNDGLIQRFQLLVYPDPLPNTKERDLIPDKQSRDAIYNLFETIDNMRIGDFMKCGANPPDDYHKRPYFRFSDEAYPIFMSYYDNLKAKADDAEHGIISEHLIKYAKTVPSLALIFHLIDCIEYGTNLGAVSLKALNAAIAWCEVLQTHMLRAYSAVTDSANIKAGYLSEKILKLVKQGTDKTDTTDWLSNGFTARQLIRKGWKGLTDSDDVQNALDVLIEHDWLKWETVASTGQGGRPTERYYINPRLNELL